MTGDWLVALDDWLTARLRRCTQCGRQDGEGAYAIVEHPPLSLAVLICARCQSRDPHRQALEALLQHRYGQAGNSAAAMNEETSH